MASDPEQVQATIDKTLALSDAATEGDLEAFGCDVVRPVPTIGTEWVQTGEGEEDGYPQQVVDGCEAEQVAHFGSEGDAALYVHARTMLPRYARALKELLDLIEPFCDHDETWPRVQARMGKILTGESEECDATGPD